MPSSSARTAACSSRSTDSSSHVGPRSVRRAIVEADTPAVYRVVRVSGIACVRALGSSRATRDPRHPAPALGARTGTKHRHGHRAPEAPLEALLRTLQAFEPRAGSLTMPPVL